MLPPKESGRSWFPSGPVLGCSEGGTGSRTQIWFGMAGVKEKLDLVAVHIFETRYQRAVKKLKYWLMGRVFVGKIWTILQINRSDQ